MTHRPFLVGISHNMQVKITYHDTDALTVEEVVRQAVHNYGKAAQIEIMPESTKPYDLIYFGLQQLITHQQLSLLFDDKLGYQASIQKLRNETLVKVEELLSQVIIDNESKVV